MDEPLPPYSYGSLGGPTENGITHELLSEIFKRLGMAFEIRLMPWARVIKTVQYGQADGIPLLMKSKERESFLIHTYPIIQKKDLVYYVPKRMGDFQWEDFTDLQGYTIGLINGYTYADSFIEALEKYHFRIEYSQDIETNFRKLAAGRVDLVIEDTILAYYNLSQHPEWKATIRNAEKPIARYCWRMGISRKSSLASHIDEINEIIAAMKKDGSLDRILKQ